MMRIHTEMGEHSCKFTELSFIAKYYNKCLILKEIYNGKYPLKASYVIR